MASISIDRKKAYNGSGSWAGLSGSDTLGTNLNRYVVYRAPVNYSNASAMTSCSLKVTLSCVNGRTMEACSHGAVVTAYLYTSDPTTGSSIAGGWVTYAQAAVTIQSNWATEATFRFTGLNITSGYVYIAIITNNTSSEIVDSIWHVSSGYGIQAPAISANFAALTFSLSVSSDSVATGGNQTVTIGNGYGRSVNVTISYNNIILYTGNTTTGSLTVAVDKSWFTTANVTSLQQLLNVLVTCSIDSSLSAYFTVTAGDDMKPTVSIPTSGGLTAENTGKALQYFPGIAIAGYSKCKVAASVVSGSNASITSVSAACGTNRVTLRHNGDTGLYEGTTPAVISSANAVMTVTVTDSRGLQATASRTLACYPYVAPAVRVDESGTYRCTIDEQSREVEKKGGEYWKAKANASYYTDLPGNSLLQFTVGISGETPVNLDSGVQTALQGGSLAPNSRYQLVFTIEDKVAPAVTRTFTLDSATRNIVFRRNARGTYLGVGTTPEGQNALPLLGSTVELPADGSFRLGGMEAQAFVRALDSDTSGASFEKNFLNINTNNSISRENAISLFNKPPTAIDASWSNYPSSLDIFPFRGYRIPLIWSSSYAMVMLIELTPTVGRLWFNFYNAGTWQGWRYSTTTALSS